MTVQELVDWCNENGRSPEYTEVYVYANSSLGWMPAQFASQVWPEGRHDDDLCLDYC